MNSTKFFWLAAALAVVLAPAGLRVAGDASTSLQPAVVAPPPAPVTFWNMLGIPQGFNKLRDARLNRLGNNPDSERVPPLKRIADPANMQSPNPAVQTAAQVKAEEDLAPQKIKAIKFLATVGCCCPQTKADVRTALLASLSDCTEAVRYEAAVAFCMAAGNCCSNCPCSCCNAEVMTKLNEMAEGKDDQGCFLEASPRVRAAACNALNACRAVFRPTGAPVAAPGPTPTPQHEHRVPDAPKPPAPPKATPSRSASGDNLPGDALRLSGVPGGEKQGPVDSSLAPAAPATRCSFTTAEDSSISAATALFTTSRR